MVSTRAAQLAKRAAARGWKLERTTAGMVRTGGGYRMVHASTGTFVAADWTRADGYGLSLDEIEDALDGAV